MKKQKNKHNAYKKKNCLILLNYRNINVQLIDRFNMILSHPLKSYLYTILLNYELQVYLD